MNCTEVLEYLSAVVDGELDVERRKELDAHIAKCRSCRSELEIETMTKAIVRAKLPSKEAPSDLRANIFQRLSAETSSQVVGQSGVRAFLGRLFAEPLVKPALALAVVVLIAIVGITLFTRREALLPTSEEHAADMIDQAVDHYSRYLNGGVKLQLASSNHEEVRRYFQDKVRFQVYVPEMENCDLIGGVLCDHEGITFLNLVYRMNDKIIYFYTGCSKEMKAVGKVGLSAKAKSDLKQSGWYFDTSRPKCNVAVWEENDEVCSVIADMKKEELLALLKE